MKKFLCVIISSLLVLCLLSGCGSSKGSYGAEDNAAVRNEYFSIESAEDSDSVAISDRKLIKTVNLSVETEKYDEYTNSLRSKIQELGGYIESYDESDRRNFRYCNFVARIPADGVSQFTDTVSKEATVKSRSESINDVTENYVDTAARLEVLKAEEEGLLEILKKSASISDIMTVRERLTAVREDIESYEAVLKSLDNKISYSSITITVNEVSHESSDKGYWAKIGSNIKEGFSNVIYAITSIFAFILSAIPYLIIPVLAAAVILIIIMVKKKKNSGKKQ